ncbi:hypothetical protein [Photobacterium ganghwense]|uniref:hypothetical protein n=1 Tax=Photobacterium ganghwense TaxID=320778 RepID=UPI001C2D6367|nr:hypothetical protein [Photobacterium ganghwense]MBV1841116.1 hypothetical protein [Photobacterium ganghwense]
MLSLLAKHSSIFLIIAAVAGFIFPQASGALFPYLPYVLFCLMLFTLLGMQQKVLVGLLAKAWVWGYAFLHAAVLTLISCTIASLLDASSSMLLAISAVTATGSLFATPAIVRSVGLAPLEAMAMTIATTLLMPVVLYINLMLFQENAFSLDLVSYLQRLLIFIVGPMMFSALVYNLVPHDTLHRIHSKLSQVTIILVFSFPFGLIGPFRSIFDDSLLSAMNYFLIGLALCALFFVAGFLVYWRTDKNMALIAAITSANRNVLLTYTVAGSYLGPDFLIIMGALQLPTYTLPLFVRWLNGKLCEPQTEESSA